MSIIQEYSLDQVRKNRRTSISIMIAVLIASTFLCSLLVFAQSFWKQMVQQEVYIAGDWDAELMDVPADRLGMIRDNGGVETMLVKGDNRTALLPEGTVLPYLLIQNCDSGYWDSMYEKSRLLRGRIPQAPGEIVVSKDFFLQNPVYGIGDTIAVEAERRQSSNAADIRQKEEESLTIVGELDVSVSSGYEGYIAYGFMEPDKLSPDSEVVVYLQMKRRGKVYTAVPQIAEAIGLIMPRCLDGTEFMHRGIFSGAMCPGFSLGFCLRQALLWQYLSILSGALSVFQRNRKSVSLVS